MSLVDLYNQLEKHDWTYHMSDDGRVYREGVRAEKALTRYATSLGEAGIDLMEKYRAYVFSGPIWGNDQLPKPDRPPELTKFLRIPSELVDGQHTTPVRSVKDGYILGSMEQWFVEALPGDSITFEVIEMSEDDFENLPDI